MKRSLFARSTAALLATGMLTVGTLGGLPSFAKAAEIKTPAASASTVAPANREEIEGIVRDYLLKNPEILLEVQKVLEDKQKEEQRLAHLDVIRNAKDQIFNASYDGFVGNPKGKVTIVEFYDYNCGFCKRAQEDMTALTAANPDLRFVLKEFPILGPDSQKASVVSMAFRNLMPEKHGEFHNLLLSAPGRAGEASAIKVALSLGVDEKKLREEMKNPAIGDAFNQTYELATKLAITGTPSYVVGNEVVFGALGQEVLSEKIAAAAACAGTTC